MEDVVFLMSRGSAVESLLGIQAEVSMSQSLRTWDVVSLEAGIGDALATVTHFLSAARVVASTEVSRGISKMCLWHPPLSLIPALTH